jgi:hypothetical protein
MSILKGDSQIALVSKQIFFNYAVKLQGHSFEDKYVIFIDITLKLPFLFLLLPVAKEMTKPFHSSVGTCSLHVWFLH